MLTKIIIVFLGLVCSINCQQRSDYVLTIESRSNTDWGDWGDEVWCPENTYANGFQLKVEDYRKSQDDTALNGIRLICSDKAYENDPTIIESKSSQHGDWKPEMSCRGGFFINAVNFRSEWDRGGRGDDTAANNLAVYCTRRKDLSQYLEGQGMGWGYWGGFETCPEKSRVCGIQTKAEDWQGKGDDTGLNRAKFFCCRF
jgi:hypothetical protein